MTKNFIALIVFILLISCSQTKPSKIIDRPVPIKNSSHRIWNQGWISVKENRSESLSNLIELPFILSKNSDSITKNESPILIMSGGPGNSSLHMANGVVNTSWAKNRDIIVFEQRGTTHSRPSLKCPEIDSLRILGLKNGKWGTQLDSLKLLGIQTCYDRLTARHIDLNGYNSLESVEDIYELQHELKIDKMILYGMSYSCNLMKAYAQTYPEKVEALILDSPLPHQVNYDEDAFQNIDATLTEIIENYTGDTQLYDRWKQYTLSVKDSVFEITIGSNNYKYTKNELIDIILFKMSSHHTLSETPTAIEEIINGEHQGIKEVINYYLEPSGQALGMRYSFWIGEELSQEKEETIHGQGEKYSWLVDYPANDVSFRTAAIWKVNSIYKDRKWPESTYNGPVLVLSGQFDPWTPTWYGVVMLENLPNAKHLIYPEHSHLPGFTKKGFSDIKKFIDQVSNE